MTKQDKDICLVIIAMKFYTPPNSIKIYEPRGFLARLMSTEKKIKGTQIGNEYLNRPKFGPNLRSFVFLF
jgi:hypothetical protein